LSDGLRLNMPGQKENALPIGILFEKPFWSGMDTDARYVVITLPYQFTT